MFEDGKGLGHRVENGKLSELVSAGGTSSLQLVFVAACHSEAAANAFRDAGVPCVVAVALRDQLHDAAAIAFTKQFYLALAVGYTTQQSFDKAKVAVKVSPELQHSAHGDLSSSEANKFKLHGSQEDRNKAVLPSLAVANPPWQYTWQRGAPRFLAPTSDRQLPAPFVLPEPFVGRALDIRAVAVRVLAGRFVTVTGDVGMGKCAVAAAAGRYLAERGHFPAGVQVLSAAEAEEWSPPQGQVDKLLLLVRCSEDRLSSEVLMGLTSDTRVHVLLTARQPFGCALPQLVENPYVLKTLAKASTEQLLRACCPERSLSPADLASIYLSTGGNPDSVRRQATHLCAGGAALLQPSLGELAPDATFLHIALHAPPVRPQLKALQRVELKDRLEELNDSLLNDSLLNSKLSNAARPVHLSDASVVHLSDASPMPLQVALAAGGIHGLVLCAAGCGWEDGDELKDRLEEVAKHCVGEKRPRVIVVCMRHGARRAAERLRSAGAPTVLWLTGDMFGKDAAPLCIALVRVLVRMDELTKEKEVVAELRKECNESVGLNEICFGCLHRSTAPGTQWKCTSQSSTCNTWCQISAQPQLLTADSTNLGGRVGDGSGLLAIDAHHVSCMQTALKGDTDRLQCIHGSSKRPAAIALQRPAAIAKELCWSYLDGKRFGIVWHVPDVAALEARLQSLAESALRTPPPMLLWVQADEPALLRRLREQLKDKTGPFRKAHVVLTCDSEPLDLDEDFEVSQLEPVELAMGGSEAATAGKLHQEFRLVALDSSGAACCLLDLYDAATIQQAVLNLLTQQLPGRPRDSTVTGIYAETGGCVLRVWVSDVSMLHWLRDTLLSGDFEGKLTKSLSRRSRSGEQPAATTTRNLDGVESSSALSVTLDGTHFAEQYEQLVLELEELTPHQQQKLAESKGHARAHVRAAAGAGKTFLALHQMLKALCADGAAAQSGLTHPTLTPPEP